MLTLIVLVEKLSVTAHYVPSLLKFPSSPKSTGISFRINVLIYSLETNDDNAIVQLKAIVCFHQRPTISSCRVLINVCFHKRVNQIEMLQKSEPAL